MKVEINLIPQEDEEVVTFRIHSLDHCVTQAVRLLTSGEKDVLLCRKNDAYYKIRVDEVLYLESVDRKVFVYTHKETLEIGERLYVLEEQLFAAGFIRISKSMLLNFEKIYSFSPKLSGNLEAFLVNGERVVISRRYVPELKRKLGMGDEE